MDKVQENKTSISRGLDAIFSANTTPKEQVSTEASDQLSVKRVAISAIKPSPFQARKVFSESALSELAASIRDHGILQPLVVRPTIGSFYELIAGERRLRAAKLINLTEVPIIECQVDDATATAFGLIENIQRENLNPMEEAEAYRKLLNEFQLSHDELANRVGKSRPHITNMLRLNQLSEEVKQSVVNGEISMGHARAILALPKNKQLVATQTVINKSMSVRRAEAYVRQLLDNEPSMDNFCGEQATTLQLEKEILNWQDQLRTKFSAETRISIDKKGRGKLTLNVESLDAMERLISRLLDENK